MKAQTPWPKQPYMASPRLPSSDSPYTNNPWRSSGEWNKPSTAISVKSVSSFDTGRKENGAAPYSSFSPLSQRVILIIATTAGFLGPLAAGVYLPALSELEDVFSLSVATINASISVFMGVLAFAPLFWATFADSLGRKPIYLVSTAIFVISNILLASLPPNTASLFVLRIMQGFGAGSGMSVAAGVVVDITEPANRGRAISMAMIGSNLGPVIGPFFGGLLTMPSWRWIFIFLAIIGFLVWLLVLCLLPETLRVIVGNGATCPKRTELQFYWPSSAGKEAISSSARVRFGIIWTLLKDPTMIILCVNTGLTFGAFYAMNVTFGRALEEIHDFSYVEIGICYLALGVALIAGSQSGGRLADHYRSTHETLASTNIIANITTPRDPAKRPYRPVTLLSFQFPGVLLCILGLVLYGWFVEMEMHAASVIVPAVLVSFGLTWASILTTTYLSLREKQHMATVVALLGMFRHLAAAIASGIVYPLIHAMGSVGACYSGLAGVLVVCVLGLVALIRLESRKQGQLEQTTLPIKEWASNIIDEKKDRRCSLGF